MTIIFNYYHYYLTQTNIYFFLQTNGNCCWEIFEKETGRGRKAELKRGDEWNPSFQPKLFRKTDCFEVKPNVKKSNF